MLNNFLLPPDFELPIAIKSPVFATPGDGKLLVCSTHDAYRLRQHYDCDTLQEVQMRARLAGARLDIWQSEREAAHLKEALAETVLENRLLKKSTFGAGGDDT